MSPSAHPTGRPKDRLLAPKLAAAFVGEVQAKPGQDRQRRKAEASQREHKRAAVERKIAGLMRAIEDGLYEPAMKTRMQALQAERGALAIEPDVSGPDLDVLLHPRLPELYRRKADQLERVLDGPNRAEALELIRSMIGRVGLRRRESGPGLMLFGDSAAILAAGSGADK